MSSAEPNPRSALRLSDARSASNWQLAKRIIGLAWRFRLSCLWVLLLNVSLIVLAISGLGLVGLGVDVLRYTKTPSLPPPHYPFGWTPPVHWPPMLIIIILAGLVLVIALVRSGLTAWSTISAAHLASRQFQVYLRRMIYDKLQRLSFRFFDANTSGSIINRVTADTNGIARFVDGVLIASIELIISLTLYLTYMISIHPGLTAACLATTPIIVFLMLRFSKTVKPAYRLNQELRDDMITRFAESVQGIHVVKGFAREQEEIREFRQRSDHVTNQQTNIFHKNSSFNFWVTLLTHVNIIVLLLYGGYLTIVNAEDPTHLRGIPLGAGLIVFAGLLQQFSNQIAVIANISNTIQSSLASAQRVFEVLDSPIEIQSPPNATKLPKAKGAIRFEHVSFSYDGTTRVLDDVSFEVLPGQCVAVVGITGAGKSTLLSMIPRFYDPEQGRVFLDGIDLRDLELDDLRRNIGLVFQESFLFSNTVAANIAFGEPNASRERIEKAARIAAAHDFVMEMPKQYDTLLMENSVNLSGGQRQRLAIARAILREPSVLIMDDPTAAVDPETEHEILAAMDQAMQNRTTFVVAHRLSTLRRADIIIVLDHGRIVDTGTHEDLMNRKGKYRQAACLQIADPESLRLLGMEV